MCLCQCFITNNFFFANVLCRFNSFFSSCPFVDLHLFVMQCVLQHCNIWHCHHHMPYTPYLTSFAQLTPHSMSSFLSDPLHLNCSIPSNQVILKGKRQKIMFGWSQFYSLMICKIIPQPKVCWFVQILSKSTVLIQRFWNTDQTCISLYFNPVSEVTVLWYLND